MYASTNIHHVKSIKVQANLINGTLNNFVSTKIVFTTEDGGEVTVSAFSKTFIEIEGSEHVNHVAQPVEEAAAYEAV